MINILIITCILMALMGIRTEKFILNPLTVFFSVWFLIFFLTSFQLYNLNLASSDTYGLMLMGSISFAVGYYVIRMYSKRKKLILRYKHFSLGVSQLDSFVLRYNWVFIIGIFCLVVYLNDATTTIRYLLNGNMLNYIRALAQDSESVLNTQQSAIIVAAKTLIVSPFIMILQPLVAFDFWLGKRNKKLLAMDIVLLFLRVITDGSRSNLIYFIMHFIVGFLFANSKKARKNNGSRLENIRQAVSKKRNKRIFFIVTVLGIVFLLWATMSRSGQYASKYTYYYFTMEPYMFETWASRVDEAHLMGYGLASTNGFTFVLFYLLKNLRVLSDYPTFWHSINTIIGETQSIWMIISGSGSRANAYVSLFWYFYLDGGIIGIILGMFIYGGITASTFWTAVKNMSARTVCMFSFILQGLLMSFVRFPFANIYYTIAFVMIFIFYKKIPTK